MMDSYSVLISVYYKEKPEFLRLAIDSIFAQTAPPDEVVLVCDGPLSPELDEVIRSFEERCGEQFRVVRLETNMGLGNALQRGIQVCRNEWIARMDSDDISLPDRMEKQLAYVRSHPEISVVGGQIEEFVDDPANPVDIRSVPLEVSQIRETLRFKNPMNHVTTLLRKSAVLAVGNYEDYPGFEDYQLWARLLSQGYQLANLNDCLCQVRIGADMYRRRGGLVFFKNTYRMQRFLLEQGLITVAQFTRNLAIRFSSAVLPNQLRGAMFRKVMRKEAKNGSSAEGEPI